MNTYIGYDFTIGQDVIENCIQEIADSNDRMLPDDINWLNSIKNTYYKTSNILGH
jgi:hypothetical protein